MDYKTAEKKLFSLINYEKLPNKGPKSLLSFLELLSRFDHPQEDLKDSVIIKGTKGKGSTSVMLHTILNNASYSSGLFTSPHLFSVRERIKGYNTYISKHDFASLIEHIFNKIQHRKGFRTYFEVLTLLSILYFKKEHTNANIFEAGLGGRLDTTRLIPSRIHILTPIGFDHVKLLGPYLAEITFEKLCGSEGLPLITPSQHPKVEWVLTNFAKWRNVQLIRENSDFHILNMLFLSTHTELTVDTRHFGKMHIHIPQIGRFLAKNAVLSCIGARLLGTKNCDLNGLSLPARFQKILNQPVLIIDGSHNPMSLLNLKSELEFYFGHIKTNRILIFGMVKDKNIETSLKILENTFDTFIFIKSDVPRSENPEKLLEIFKKISSKKALKMGREKALDFALNNGRLIVITGSFYVAGDFIRILIENHMYPESELYSLIN